MDWNAAADRRLTGLWHDGDSTAEIGRKMGCTKNSIIGRAHRLGLPKRPSPIQSNPRLSQASEQRARNLAEASRLAQLGLSPERIARQLGIHVDTVSKLLRPLGLAGRQMRPRVTPARCAVPAPPVSPPAAPRRPGAPTCRFPIGEPGTPQFRYCDAGDVMPGKPYCAEHCALSYTRPFAMSVYLRGRGFG